MGRPEADVLVIAFLCAKCHWGPPWSTLLASTVGSPVMKATGNSVSAKVVEALTGKGFSCRADIGSLALFLIPSVSKCLDYVISECCETEVHAVNFMQCSESLGNLVTYSALLLFVRGTLSC